MAGQLSSHLADGSTHLYFYCLFEFCLTALCGRQFGLSLRVIPDVSADTNEVSTTGSVLWVQGDGKGTVANYWSETGSCGLQEVSGHEREV